MYHIFSGLDIRPDVGHRETLILFTGALRALSEILLNGIELHLSSAVNTDIFARAHFLPGLSLLCQVNHQLGIWLQRLFMAFVLPHLVAYLG